MSHKTKARWKVVLNIVTFLAFAGTMYALRHQIAESLQNLGRVDTFALWFMIPLQIINYHAYTNQARSIYRVLGERLRYRPMLRLMLELNFVNHVFPSGGVTGLSYFSVRMKDAQVSTSKTSLVYLLRFILVFLSFQILLAIGLLMLAVDGKANGLVLLVGGSLATLTSVGTVVIAFIIGSKTRINSFFVALTKGLNKVIRTIRPKHTEAINVSRVKGLFEELHQDYMLVRNDIKSLTQPLAWSLLVSVSEVATVYSVYIAFGAWVNPGAVILAYAVANFAGFISVVPGGFGIYEALMTAVLVACGVSPGISIPVTVMYRVISTLLQVPFGYYYYHKKMTAKVAPPA